MAEREYVGVIVEHDKVVANVYQVDSLRLW
jgi:hypothetical protein